MCCTSIYIAHKKNEIVKKFLLARSKFMAEIHLQQLGFTYRIERIENFMQIGNRDYIYKNDLDKACFQHDMGYGKYKGLVKRTQSDKVL